MFDKEFFATALPVAIGHYRAGVAAPSAQLLLTALDGQEYKVRRVLAAADGWVSLEVVDDEHGPDEVALLFVPYEAIRRVVFDPKAAPDPQLGFRLHRPGAGPEDMAGTAEPAGEAVGSQPSPSDPATYLPAVTGRATGGRDRPGRR